MRAKPEKEPWVHTYESNIELRRSGTSNARIGIYPLGCAAPAELNKCVETINPGLAPWAMQECRPVGALLHFHHQSIIFLRLIRFPFFRYLQVVVRNGEMDGIR